MDDNGKVVKRRANGTGEQQLDDVDWQFYDIMQHKASVCPPGKVIMQNVDPSTKYLSCTDGPFDTCMEGSLGETNCKVTDDSPTQVTNDAKGSKQKANRPDEASSPARKAAMLGAKLLALELRRCGGSCLGGRGGAWEAALPSRSRST